MAISSPTITPPVSRAAFQVRPKSLRLILVFASTPMRVLPHGSFEVWVGPSTAKVTLWVIPLDGQVAGDVQFSIRLDRDVRRLQEHLGKLLDVEELGALEMGIAGLVAGVDGGNVDRGLYGRLRQIILIER